jgi:hypothetical protein
MPRKLEVEVGLDVLAPLLQARQRERPQIEPRKQVLAEAPGQRPTDPALPSPVRSFGRASNYAPPLRQLRVQLSQ